jgi:hypothetical protein
MDGYVQKVIIRETTKRGGGIMLFVKDNLNVKSRQHKIDCNDGLELELTYEKTEKTVRILATYRKPDSDKKKFVTELKKINKRK